MAFEVDRAVLGGCWLRGATGTGPSEMAWRRRSKAPKRMWTVGVIA